MNSAQGKPHANPQKREVPPFCSNCDGFDEPKCYRRTAIDPNLAQESIKMTESLAKINYKSNSIKKKKITNQENNGGQ
jgi:hypothetical protein